MYKPNAPKMGHVKNFRDSLQLTHVTASQTRRNRQKSFTKRNQLVSRSTTIAKVRTIQTIMQNILGHYMLKATSTSA